MKRTNLKLQLNRQTIRALSTTELAQAGGGGTAFCPATGTCSADCNSVGCTEKCADPTPTADCTAHS